MKNSDTLVIYTQYPEPGRVKTRLFPVLGEQGAASLHERMTRSILETAGSLVSTDGVSLEVHFNAESAGRIRAAFGSGYAYIPQSGEDLGERMLNSFSRCLDNGAHKVVLIGSDCPGITGSIIRQAFASLEEKDCVLGPSRDGGYYLIGLKRPIPGLFSAIPWGTDSVSSRTLEAAAGLGLQTTVLQELVDIDRPEELSVWEEKIRTSALPMISVIIPALNEGDRIEEVIRRASRGKQVEIIIADGGSADMTRKKAALLGARVIETKPGRGSQMNEGARHALGDILFFLHADSHVPDDYDDEIRTILSGQAVAAGAFKPAFDSRSPAMRIIAGGAHFRSRFLHMPYGDQGLFIRKDTFQDTGGFPEIPIMEDVAFIRALRSRGRIAVSQSAVATSSRRYQELGPMKTWLLNQLAMAAYFLNVPLDSLAALYRGRESSIRAWFSLYKSRGSE